MKLTNFYPGYELLHQLFALTLYGSRYDASIRGINVGIDFLYTVFPIRQNRALRIRTSKRCVIFLMLLLLPMLVLYLTLWRAHSENNTSITTSKCSACLCFVLSCSADTVRATQS